MTSPPNPKTFLTLPVSLLLLAGCTSSEPGIVRLDGTTMGTTYQVTYAPGDTSPADDRESIEALLLEINQSLSTYIETSLISTINRSSDTAVSHPVDDHFATVFGQATLVYRDTDGAFNPAVGPLVNAWGFGPAGATTTPEPESIPSLLELVDFDAFQMRPASRTLQKSPPSSKPQSKL